MLLFLGRIMGRWAVDENMEDDRVFAYVNFERVRRPTTHALYDVVGDALQGEGCGGTRANGVST